MSRHLDNKTLTAVNRSFLLNHGQVGDRVLGQVVYHLNAIDGLYALAHGLAFPTRSRARALYGSTLADDLVGSAEGSAEQTELLQEYFFDREYPIFCEGRTGWVRLKHLRVGMEGADLTDHIDHVRLRIPVTGDRYGLCWVLEALFPKQRITVSLNDYTINLPPNLNLDPYRWLLEELSS